MRKTRRNALEKATFLLSCERSGALLYYFYILAFADGETDFFFWHGLQEDSNFHNYT